MQATTLAEAIRLAIHRSGKSAQAIAKEIKVTPRTLSNWQSVKDPTSPKFPDLVRLAVATGQPIEEFAATIDTSDVRSTSRYAAQLLLPFDDVATVHDIDAERLRRRTERTAEVLEMHTRLRLA